VTLFSVNTERTPRTISEFLQIIVTYYTSWRLVGFMVNKLAARNGCFHTAVFPYQYNFSSPPEYALFSRHILGEGLGRREGTDF
jgi:hypothetical protein